MPYFRTITTLVVAACAAWALGEAVPARAYTVTTTVSLTVCGDGQVDEGAEVCDTITNTGEYSTSIAGANCTPGCQAWAPYCGDTILHPQQGEECDDGNNTVSDRCSDVCKIENLPEGCCPGAGPGPASGGGPYSPGGNTPQNETKVAIYGRAYPNATVTILRDGVVVGAVTADTDANFYFATTDVTPGTATFGFWAADKSGKKSITHNVIFRVVPNAVTTVAGVFLPPTITANATTVAADGSVLFSGQTVPHADVLLIVDDAEGASAIGQSDAAGDWQTLLEARVLAPDQLHAVRPVFQTGTSTQALRSVPGETVNIFVGTGGVIDTRNRADINRDGKVNFTDFSILIFYWNSANNDADINLDGRVNLVDFSLLIYNWTG